MSTWSEQAVFDVLDDDQQQQRPSRADDWNTEYRFDDLVRHMEEEEQQQQQQQHGGSDKDIDSPEQRLSQRLSQLSATSEYEREPSVDGKRRRLPAPPMLPATAAKKSRTSMDEASESKPWPAYLLAKHHIFDQILRTNTSTRSTTIDVEDLRRLAYFAHHIAEWQLSKELWSAYSKSGAGQLNEARSSTRHDRPFWPEHVEAYMARQRSTLPREMSDADEQHVYERLVSQRRAQIDDGLVRYQHQYDALKSGLVGFTPAMEQTLNTIVQQLGIVPLRWVVDTKLAVLRCDYQDHQLQGQYQEAQPNRYQVRRTLP